MIMSPIRLDSLSMLTNTFQIYGQPKPPAELLPLRAGPLTLLYDPTTGMVRRIKNGEIEVLRGIYAAVRDRNWGTVPATLREITRCIEPERFRIEFESVHEQAGLHFVWRGSFLGEANGTLRYEFAGEARTTFLRNRIGFCVLHPIRECAGMPAKQIRIDGAEVASRFPDLIEPQIFGQSSFRDLRAVAHEVAAGLWAELEFEGDTFEMEDQRNWTDASFKTYCTPLARAFPVEVQAGTRIHQAVTLKLIRSSGHESALASPCLGKSEPTHVGGCQVADGAHGVPRPTEITVALPNAEAHRLPDIGLCVASHGAELCAEEIAALRELKPAHLRVDVRTANADCVAALSRAAREAVALDAALELAIHLPRQGEAEAAELVRVVKSSGVRVARILALREGEAATTPATLATVRKLFSALAAPIGAGSDCNFCELNREHALGRLARSEADFLFWSINPQVHAFDHLSIVETLEAQIATANSARAFAAGRPLVVTPVTLKQRFNPVATSPEPEPPPGELPPQVDPRQLSLFGAAWTLGSLAALATAGVESATFYETTGWRGVMETKSGSPLSRKFPSEPRKVFPVFQAFAAMSGFDRVAPATSDSRLVALALFNPARGCRLLLANLTHAPLEIQLAGCGEAARVGLLDATSLKAARHQPGALLAQKENVFPLPSGGVKLTLLPYALACVDWP